MAKYYDLLLGFVPLAFVGFTSMAALFSVSLLTGVTLGALVALALVVHGLFVNAPTDVSTRRPQPDHAQPNHAVGFETAD